MNEVRLLAISNQQLTLREKYLLMKRYFRLQLRVWHPDLNSNPMASEVTLMLIDALEKLERVYKRLGGV